MAKQRKWSFFKALDDPFLPEEDQARYLALKLMDMVREIESEGGPLPEPLNFEEEVARLKTSFECVNCNKEIDRAALYCGHYCQQLAGTIRYARKAVAENRIKKVDIQQAIGIRLLMLHGGGYPTNDRILSEDQCRAILERDSYKCQICGKQATQIDHISGSSDDPSNLRALCADCNRKEAFKNARPATPKEEESIKNMYRGMSFRIAASVPLRACDDYERWNKLQGSLCGSRHRLLRELEEEMENDFEDIDGYLRHSMEKDD